MSNIWIFAFIEDLDEVQSNWVEGNNVLFDDEDNGVASDINTGLGLYLDKLEDDGGWVSTGRSKRFTMEFNGMQGMWGNV